MIPRQVQIIRRLSESSGPGHWQILPGTNVVVRDMENCPEMGVPVPIEYSSQPESIVGCFECSIVGPLQEDQNCPTLLIRCTDISHLTTFASLAASVIDSGTNDPNIVLQLLHSEINNARNQFSVEEASGLFGELYFMARWLDCTWDSRIRAWLGPEGSSKDFDWSEEDGLFVEVKTTQQVDDPFVHPISSLEQLSCDGEFRLVLFSMSAKPSESGEESLRRIVDEIIEQIAGDQNLIEQFRLKLSKTGYNPAIKSPNFSVQESLCRLYLVEGAFPHLSLSETDGDGQLSSLDERISISKYSIRMEGLEENQLDLQSPVTPDGIISHISENNL